MIPKISLIIPVYNAQDYLKRCLDSAINQTMKEIEFIIVNDGSTDGSLTICKKYAKQDSRIILINQENYGVAMARNTGILSAKGDYLAFLDSDDYIEKDMLMDMYTKAKQDNSDIVTCQFQHIDDKGIIKYKSNYLEREKDAYFRNILAAKYYSVIWNSIYKKDLFINNDIAFPNEIDYEDVATTYKVFFYATKISILEKVYYNWSFRNDSRSNVGLAKDQHIDSIFKILEMTKQFLQNEKSLDRYSHEYNRRVFYYLVGLIKKIRFRAWDNPNLILKIVKIIDRIKVEGYETENALAMLKRYDKNLWTKYIEFITPLNNKLFDLLALEDWKVNLINKDLCLEKVKKQKEQIETKDKWIAKQNVRITTRDNNIIKLKDTIEKQNVRITTRDNNIIKLKDTIEKQNVRITTRDNEIIKLKDTIEKQNVRITTRDNEIINLKDIIETQNIKLTNIQQYLKVILNIKFLSNPIKKYKAYKNLLKVIR